jgi:hypothetical protein
MCCIGLFCDCQRRSTGSGMPLPNVVCIQIVPSKLWINKPLLWGDDVFAGFRRRPPNSRLWRLTTNLRHDKGARPTTLLVPAQALPERRKALVLRHTNRMGQGGMFPISCCTVLSLNIISMIVDETSNKPGEQAFEVCIF